jgi:hypothetical protein
MNLNAKRGFLLNDDWTNLDGEKLTDDAASILAGKAERALDLIAVGARTLAAHTACEKGGFFFLVAVPWGVE